MDAPFGAAILFERLVRRFFLLGCSVLTGLVVVAVRPSSFPRFPREPVTLAGWWSGRCPSF
jgi:hypothetical protein